jgi:CheY-like chemotaxis protein
MPPISTSRSRRKSPNALMDAQMPVLGGADATAQIRQLPGAQPAVIAVTASVPASDREAS